MQRSAAVFLVVVVGIPIGGCAGVLGLDAGDPLDFDSGVVPGTDGMVLPDAAPDGALPPVDAADAGCAADEKTCGGACVKIQDPNFGCGPTTCDPCASSNVQTRTCVSGACQITCKAGYADCDPKQPGCETALGSDQNCATCGNACGAGAPFCDTSKTPPVCSASCNSPKTQCGANCWNIQTDADHCGATCAQVMTCASPANADRGCTAGICTYACQPPFSACGGSPAGGCLYNTSNDLGHCGGSCVDCNKVTPLNTHATGCGSGTCQFACNNGYSDCDGISGCECFGTCSAGTCVPYDAGNDGGSCSPGALGCTSDGQSCSTNEQCCGCGCVMGVCCYETGKIVSSLSQGQMFCCSHACTPIATPDGGASCQCD